MFVSLAGPTSPAYSWRHGVRTEPGCFADRSFSTQAYKPRVLTDITCLRVAVPKTSFFCCLHLSSIRVSRSFPHRLADVRISVSTSFVRCYGVARGVPEDGSGRGLPSTAFRPLDPTLIAQCFPPIGRRPVACSAIVLRLALREGRPISRARLLFYPAIRVDSPTSPAVACSVRKQPSCCRPPGAFMGFYRHFDISREMCALSPIHSPLRSPTQYSPTSPAYSPSSPAVRFQRPPQHFDLLVRSKLS